MLRARSRGVAFPRARPRANNGDTVVVAGGPFFPADGYPRLKFPSYHGQQQGQEVKKNRRSLRFVRICGRASSRTDAAPLQIALDYVMKQF